jgi:hypothetical protein
MKVLKLVPAAFLLSACVMTGQPFWQPAEFQQSPASGKTRMVFYWPKYEYDIMPNGARIFINGEYTDTIGYLKYRAADVTPGDKFIEVDALSTPGKCAIKAATKVDEKHFFEISLRSDHMTKMGATNAVSAAEKAPGKECQGMFSVTEVSEEHALSRMQPRPTAIP